MPIHKDLESKIANQIKMVDAELVLMPDNIPMLEVVKYLMTNYPALVTQADCEIKLGSSIFIDSNDIPSLM